MKVNIYSKTSKPREKKKPDLAREGNITEQQSPEDLRSHYVVGNSRT